MQKKDRMLDIFYRLVKGEDISLKGIAEEYEVSTKSISRDISEIKSYFSDKRELTGSAEIKYASGTKTYYLQNDNFLLSKELIALIKMMIGCRAFSKMEVLEMISKLKNFTTHHDRKLLEHLVLKEMYHYNEVRHDCESVIDNLWQLTRCIDARKEITITYYKIDRNRVERRIMPIALTFSDYYFYLIAYYCDAEKWIPLYYRVDRITNIVEHRKQFKLDKEYDFDEGDLRSKIQFMRPGEYRKIKFSYNGPSVQAILDKIPTARVISVDEDKKIIEAETYGIGINMFLLSQGSMVEVLEPKEFVDEMAGEIAKMAEIYCQH